MAKKFYKITFIGDPKLLKMGYKQKSYGPHWPGGLEPGESAMLPEVPDSCYGSARAQFLVDGKVWESGPPSKKAAEKPKKEEPKE